MDINEHNPSRHYSLDGVAELPALWRSVAASRSAMSPEEWVEQVKTYLRQHATLVGSPNISTRRTEIYNLITANADLDQVETDVSRLVDVSETYRVNLEGIERDFSARANALFRF